MSQRLYITLVVLLTAYSLPAQNFKQALERMRTRYEQSEKFHIVMRIQAFESDGAAVAYYNDKAEVMRSGNNYLSRFGESDMLMNEDYFIMVDKSSHEIVCNPRSLKAEKETFKDMIKMSLDSILTLYGEPKYASLPGGVDHYRVHQKRGPIGEVEISINTNTGLLNEMAYHYHNGQYVKITFEIFDLNPVFQTGTFDEAQYIAHVKGKTTAAPAFRKYTVTEPTK